MFPIGDPVCSIPANSTFAAVELKGYVYDTNNMMARLPEPYGDGNEQGTVWRLILDQQVLAFLPLTSDATATVPDFLYGGIEVATTCPDGTISSDAGCVACEPGSWCTGGVSTPCDAGAWVDGGSWQRAACLLACLACLLPACMAGQRLTRRLPLPPACLPADTYNPILGASDASVCLSCFDDFGETFGSDAGAATCWDGVHHIDCARGSAAALGYGAQLDKSGSTSLGFVWDDDSAKCAACAAGSFQDSTGSAPFPQECSLCPAGTSTNGKNGTYGAGAGAACSTCGAGTFASYEGTDACDVCPTGLISRDNSTTGNVACTPW